MSRACLPISHEIAITLGIPFPVAIPRILLWVMNDSNSLDLDNVLLVYRFQFFSQLLFIPHSLHHDQLSFHCLSLLKRTLDVII
jgi:hypothetical protein